MHPALRQASLRIPRAGWKRSTPRFLEAVGQAFSQDQVDAELDLGFDSWRRAVLPDTVKLEIRRTSGEPNQVDPDRAP